MYQGILADPKFFVLLFEYDQDRARKSHGTQCENCGGKLDWANYPRQPRGGPPDLEEKCKIRFSLCCREEGCRKRVRPPSIRFLGRRVYFSVIFSLVIALSHGAPPQKIAKIKKTFGITQQTFLRWRMWWKEVFPTTKFWQREKSRFSFLEESELPQSVLSLFSQLQGGQKALLKFLCFISPLDSVK